MIESLAFSAELEARLRELIEVLLEANTQFNLTAIRDPEEAWVKHVLDSLAGLASEDFDGQKTLVDVGSGAGFPGLPLALARPELRVSFVESTGKKCGFISRTSEHFGLKTNVINARAEEVGQDERYRAQFDIATARALGSFTEVAEYCLPLVKVGGLVVLWRGQNAETEAQDSEEALDELGGALRDVESYELPGHPMLYHLVTIEKHSNTPRTYPRRVGQPKAKPLGI